MFPTFNYANLRTDADGMTYLDLEIQVLFNDQKVLIRNTFPATSNFQASSNYLKKDGQENPRDGR
jgi:hypothetical protein